MKIILIVILTAVFVSAHAQNNLTKFQTPEGLRLPAKFQKYFNNLPNQSMINKTIELHSFQAKKANSLKKTIALKAANEEKYLLDSIVTKDTISNTWINSKKELFTYDPRGSQLSNTRLLWNATLNIWINSTQTLYTYDHNGYTTSNTSQEWNSTSNIWVNKDKVLQTFDDVGNMLSYGNQTWDTISKTWINTSQTLNSFRINGKDSVTLNQTWDTISKTWINTSQTLYSFRINGKDSATLSQRWDTTSNEWINTYRKLSVYDFNGFMISDTSQNWDGITQKWVNSLISSYTNDTNGNKLERNTQLWDFNTKAWRDYEREFWTYYNSGKIFSDTLQNWNNITNKWNTMVFTYNENRKTLSFIFFDLFQIFNAYDISGKDSSSTFIIWDSNSKVWINNSYTLYVNNENGDRLNNITYNWDTVSNTWVKTNKATYYYSLQSITNKHIPSINWDNPADITYGTLLSDTQLNAQADVTGTFTYTPVEGTKLEVGNNQKLLLHFVPQDTALYLSVSDSVYINVLPATGISVLQSNAINVYPSPALNTINITQINGSITYAVYDLTGKIVVSGNTSTNQINVSSLARGIYIIKVSGIQGNITGRFVKQ